MKKLVFFLFILIISSCGPNARQRYLMNNNIGGSYQVNVSQVCNCTFNFQPVCGVDKKTYENACIAKCNGITFSLGACDTNPNQCNINSGAVCGMPKGTSTYKNYINECEIYKDNAVLMNFGKCPSI